MAKIKLSARKDWEPIPEGRHVFQVVDIKVNPKTNVIEMQAQIEDGRRTKEFFRIGKGKAFNEVALDIFSSVSRAVLGDVEEVDPEELEGGFFEAEAVHDVQPHRDDPKRKVTWVNLKYYSPAEGWDVEDDVDEDDEDDDDYDPFG